MSLDFRLDWLLKGVHSEIAAARDLGLNVTFPAEKLPHDAARRLLEALDVDIVEAPRRVEGRGRGRPMLLRVPPGAMPSRAVVQARVRRALERSTAPATDRYRCAAAEWLAEREAA